MSVLVAKKGGKFLVLQNNFEINKRVYFNNGFEIAKFLNVINVNIDNQCAFIRGDTPYAIELTGYDPDSSHREYFIVIQLTKVFNVPIELLSDSKLGSIISGENAKPIENWVNINFPK